MELAAPRRLWQFDCPTRRSSIKKAELPPQTAGVRARPIENADPDTLPSTAETPHGFLRRETERWHIAVEQAFAGFDLQTRVGLGAFLCAQAAAVLPIERELDRAGVENVVPDWPSRRRSTALRADLDHLGFDVPSTDPVPPIETRGRMLGAMYVLEGSRLGGSVLARVVSGSADAAVREATSFLAHEPGSRLWTQFRLRLNEADVDRGELLAGAEQTFAIFLQAAQAQSKKYPDAA